MFIDAGLVLRAVAASSSLISTLPAKNTWQPAGPGDLRSPCPGLNTLANHGLLPRNGKNITSSQFTTTIVKYYNLSPDLANRLIASPIATLADPVTKTMNLSALALHNVFEHDASLVHADAAPGAKYAPTVPDLGLAYGIVSTFPKGIGLQELAQIRVERESGLATPLSEEQETVALGESALLWSTMKDATSGKVPVETFVQFMVQERFPDSYNIPKEAVTVDLVQTTSVQIATDMAAD